MRGTIAARAAKLLAGVLGGVVRHVPGALRPLNYLVQVTPRLEALPLVTMMIDLELVQLGLNALCGVPADHARSASKREASRARRSVYACVRLGVYLARIDLGGCMTRPHLFCAIAFAVTAAACERPATRADVKDTAAQVASDVKSGTAKAAAAAGNQLADGWLTTKIQSKFAADHDIKASDIDVSSRDGVVTLKGRAENEPMRSLAVAIARNTDGVKQVIDQLSVAVAAPVDPTALTRGPAPSASGAVATGGTTDTVGGPAGAVDDRRITSSIQASYFLNESIKGRHIDVDTTNGVVTLRGDVGNESERAEALRLARTTEGVRRVEDSLAVVEQNAPQTAVANTVDGTLVTQLKSRLSGDSQTKSANLEVTANNGVVLLEGSVATDALKERALTLARETDGVTQVVDRVRVTPAHR